MADPDTQKLLPPSLFNDIDQVFGLWSKLDDPAELPLAHLDCALRALDLHITWRELHELRKELVSEGKKSGITRVDFRDIVSRYDARCPAESTLKYAFGIFKEKRTVLVALNKLRWAVEHIGEMVQSHEFEALVNDSELVAKDGYLDYDNFWKL